MATVKQEPQFNAATLAELQALRAENQQLRRASLSSNKNTLFAQIENHREQRKMDALEEEMDEDPWCKTRRQKLVCVHVLSFIIGLGAFMYGLYLIVFAAGLRSGNTFIPLLFSVLGGLFFVDGTRRLRRDMETGRCPGQRDIKRINRDPMDVDDDVEIGLINGSSYDGDDFHSSIARMGNSINGNNNSNRGRRATKTKRQSRIEAEAALKLIKAREEYENRLDSSESEEEDISGDETEENSEEAEEENIAIEKRTQMTSKLPHQSSSNGKGKKTEKKKKEKTHKSSKKSVKKGKGKKMDANTGAAKQKGDGLKQSFNKKNFNMPIAKAKTVAKKIETEEQDNKPRTKKEQEERLKKREDVSKQKLAPLPSLKTPNSLLNNANSDGIPKKTPLGSIGKTTSTSRSDDLKSVLLPNNTTKPPPPLTKPPLVADNKEIMIKTEGLPKRIPKPPSELPPSTSTSSKQEETKIKKTPIPPPGPPPQVKPLQGEEHSKVDGNNPFDDTDSSSNEDGNPFD